jgi:predicted nucleotidyltransferase
MKSKKNNLLKLFYNNSRQWHFEELLKETHISRPQLARWLKILEDEKIIKKIKNNNKMPFYIQNFKNTSFKNKKKLYAQNKLLESGLIDYLLSLDKIKVIIIFGSFSRSDWHKESDIDIFLYGSKNNIEIKKYESILNRDIEIFTAKDTKDLKRIDRLLPYIISGNFIKGNLQDMDVEINVKV